MALAGVSAAPVQPPTTNARTSTRVEASGNHSRSAGWILPTVLGSIATLGAGGYTGHAILGRLTNGDTARLRMPHSLIGVGATALGVATLALGLKLGADNDWYGGESSGSGTGGSYRNNYPNDYGPGYPRYDSPRYDPGPSWDPPSYDPPSYDPPSYDPPSYGGNSSSNGNPSYDDF